MTGKTIDLLYKMVEQAGVPDDIELIKSIAKQCFKRKRTKQQYRKLQSYYDVMLIDPKITFKEARTFSDKLKREKFHFLGNLFVLSDKRSKGPPVFSIKVPRKRR